MVEERIAHNGTFVYIEVHRGVIKESYSFTIDAVKLRGGWIFPYKFVAEHVHAYEGGTVTVDFRNV